MFSKCEWTFHHYKSHRRIFRNNFDRVIICKDKECWVLSSSCWEEQWWWRRERWWWWIAYCERSETRHAVYAVSSRPINALSYYVWNFFATLNAMYTNKKFSKFYFHKNSNVRFANIMTLEPKCDLDMQLQRFFFAFSEFVLVFISYTEGQTWITICL